MKIDLAPQLEQMVREKVEAGIYDSADAVIADALAQMRDRDEADRIKATRLLEALDRGLKEVAEGRYEVFESDKEIDAFFKSL